MNVFFGRVGKGGSVKAGFTLSTTSRSSLDVFEESVVTGPLGEPNPNSNSVHSSRVLLKFFVVVSSSFGKVLSLTVVFDVIIFGRLSKVVGDEDAVREEFMEKNKVISNVELFVELADVGVDLVVDVGFEIDVDVDFMLALVEIDAAVELGCIVEANVGEVDTGLEFFSDVEEYLF